jgi:hypothetical protein
MTSPLEGNPRQLQFSAKFTFSISSQNSESRFILAGFGARQGPFDGSFQRLSG